MLNILSGIFLLITSSFSGFITPSVQVQGKVISADTRQPINNAYIYIVKGEEETLTNSKGEFSITTSEQLPFTLTVIHKDFKKAKVQVTSTGQSLSISLDRK